MCPGVKAGFWAQPGLGHPALHSHPTLTPREVPFTCVRSVLGEHLRFCWSKRFCGLQSKPKNHGLHGEITHVQYSGLLGGLGQATGTKGAVPLPSGGRAAMEQPKGIPRPTLSILRDSVHLVPATPEGRNYHPVFQVGKLRPRR